MTQGERGEEGMSKSEDRLTALEEQFAQVLALQNSTNESLSYRLHALENPEPDADTLGGLREEEYVIPASGRVIVNNVATNVKAGDTIKFVWKDGTTSVLLVSQVPPAEGNQHEGGHVEADDDYDGQWQRQAIRSAEQFNKCLAEKVTAEAQLAEAQNAVNVWCNRHAEDVAKIGQLETDLAQCRQVLERVTKERDFYQKFREDFREAAIQNEQDAERYRELVRLQGEKADITELVNNAALGALVRLMREPYSSLKRDGDFWFMQVPGLASYPSYPTPLPTCARCNKLMIAGQIRRKTEGGKVYCVPCWAVMLEELRRAEGKANEAE